MTILKQLLLLMLLLISSPAQSNQDFYCAYIQFDYIGVASADLRSLAETCQNKDVALYLRNHAYFQDLQEAYNDRISNITLFDTYKDSISRDELFLKKYTLRFYLTSSMILGHCLSAVNKELNVIITITELRLNGNDLLANRLEYGRIPESTCD